MPSNIHLVQRKAWSILSRSFKADRVASTYLLHGPDGLGHWPLAISFAALLNCTDILTDEETDLLLPCGRCRSCRRIDELNSEVLHTAVPVGPHKNHDQMVELINEFLEQRRREPFRILTARVPVNIPIDRAREIKKSLSLKNAGGFRRVVLFSHMHRMKTASADALLKMIEEPPADTVIILTAEKPEMLLPTIQSRAQKIRLDRVPEAMAVEYLVSNYDLAAERARLMVRIASGNLGRSIAMVDDFEEPDTSRRAVGFLLFKSLFSADNPSAVAMLIEMVNDRDRSAATELLVLWQSLVRDCAYYAATGDESAIVNVDFSPELTRIARFFEQSELAGEMTDCLKIALADLALNVHIQAALVALALKLKSRIQVAA
ncbi:MAG: hypothetical protein JSU65_06635 [Candidatus Zixiibacteriota bacterium]|nr:MAG: hypothetical protein JSU65_06635 [candidate division Zixibacteria bacterium]